MAKSIKWEMGKYGVLRGTVDGLELFTLDQSTTRDPAARKWFLRTELPGYVKQVTVKDESAGMEVALDLLAGFVKRLT